MLRNITRLHFCWHIRTAGLEQEVENLKKKLTDCIKENSNIKEELSEAQRIKVSFYLLFLIAIEFSMPFVSDGFPFLFPDVYRSTPQVGGCKGICLALSCTLMCLLISGS